MAFKKGQDKPEGSGIKKGDIHYKTMQWKMLGEYLTGEGLDRFMQYLKSVDDKTFASHYMTLIEYFKPKVNKTNSAYYNEVEKKNMDWLDLS